MVRTFPVRLNAAHPELPLMEASAIVGSPSTAFISRVPATVGTWTITKVYAQAEYPDGTINTVEAQKGAEGIWTATLPATQTSGRVKCGFTVLADGIDELGEPVTGYTLGIADMAVYTRDLVIVPGETGYALRYFDVAPNPPKKGDVAPIDGVIKMYDGTQWVSLGGASDYSELDNKPSINDVELDGNKTGAALGLLSLIGGTLTGGVDWTNKSYPLCINKLPPAYEEDLANTPKLAEIASKGFIGWFPGNRSYLVMSQYDLNGWPDIAWSDGEHEYGILLEDRDADGSLFLYYYNGTESQSYHLQPYGGDIAMQYYIALAFSETKDYAQGAIVYKDGFIYKALVHHRGAWNASHFEITTIAAAIESATSEAEGKADPSLIGIPAFSTESTYTIGAKVVYDNALWNCTTAVETAGAWTGTTNWTKVVDIETGAPASGGTKMMTNGQVFSAISGLASKEEITPLQFAAWYPDGSVTSASQFTAGIKYSYNDANNTAAVLPFYPYGTADQNNADLIGRVVIPPYTDYNGKRYAVTSIAGTSSYSSLDNPALTALVAPTTVTSVGALGISKCINLVSVYLPSVTTVGANVLQGDISLVDVQMPKLTAVPQTAFSSCSALKSIVLPSATTMAGNAFYNTSLVDVYLPAMTNLGMTAFGACGSLKTVYCPSITTIDTSVFYNASALEVLDFGNTLTAVPPIGVATFSNANPCIIVVPDALYSEWTTALYWMSLPSQGFRFLKHSEWECARGYAVDDKLALKQAKITASGVLKGDGAGGVSAAVAGTDYQTPITVDASPTQSSTNPVQSGGVYTALLSKADASALRYALGETITATTTLADRTNNRVVPAADNTVDIVLSFPATVTGRARDFLALITNTTGNTGSISFSAPSGATVYGDGLSTAIPEGETWLITITEVAGNTFFTKALKMEVAA